MEGVPVRVVYIDSLIWLQQLGSLADIKARLEGVLKAEAGKRGCSVPVILPQPKWEELVEDKPAVYENLKADGAMLETHWVKLTPDQIQAIQSKELDETATATAASTTASAATTSAATSSVAPEPDVQYEKKASPQAKEAIQIICKELIGEWKKGKYVVKGEQLLHAKGQTRQHA